MKKKITPYKFENPTFDMMWDVDIKPKNHIIQSDYHNYDTKGGKVSEDILMLMEYYVDFSDELYKFVKNYNETWKNLKMKKEHQTVEYCGVSSSMMTLSLIVKNGVGYVSYFPLVEDEHEYEKKMWGEFKINKTDLLKFLNDYSKKVKFNGKKEETENFKRVGNWYSVEVGNTNYNVIIQKEPNSFNCEPSSVIIFDEKHKLVSPYPDRKNIYDKIESIMNKVDFKYDEINND